MRKNIILLVLIFLLTGCSSEQEVLSDLKPTGKGNYSMFV